MEFSFVNNKGEIQTLKLKMGDNWAEKAAGNEELNSIFALVDDKDGIVEESEFNLLKKLLEKADTLVEKTSNDKQITKEELQELSKQVKNDSIDIEKVKHEAFNEKLDLDFYSLEAIKERYPSDKFKVKYYDNSAVGYSCCLGEIDLLSKPASCVFVFDKQKNIVLDVIYDSAKPCIKTRNGKDVELEQHFDKNGNLFCYAFNGEITNFPAMDRVYKSITAKKWGGLVPTTGKDFLQNLKQIPPEFIEPALTYYEKTYGQSLMDAINEEWGLDSKIKKEALEYIKGSFEVCLNARYDYDENFQQENTQISNNYYKGQNYSVKQDGEKLLITNNDNGIKYTIDTEMLTQKLSLKERVELKGTLQKLPAEVLADLAMELEIIQSFTSKNTKSNDAAGFYHPLENEVSLYGLSDIGSLIHEIGHSVDFNGTGNESSIEKNPEFISTFNEEMEAYLALGHKCYSFKDKESRVYKGISTYATYNKKEMFAECYTLLMSGKCISDSIIVNHFPKTLEVVKKHIEYVRSLPKIVRMQDHIPSWIDRIAKFMHS